MTHPNPDPKKQREETARVIGAMASPPVTGAKRNTFEGIHRALFPKGSPKRRKLAELKQGPARYVRKHQRRH